MQNGMIALALAASLAVLTSPVQGQEPGWYRVVMDGQDSFTARLLNEEEGFYVLSFQGSVLRVAKESVKRIERAGTEPGSTKAPGTEKLTLEQEEAIRDAIEALSSPEDGAVRKAYRSLSADFKAARPYLHLSLHHQNHRVRSLAVKLLGEKGTAQEDLPAAAGRLADERPSVRLAAVKAVRALGPEGLPDLVRYLERESLPNHRKMAVKTFQFWKDARAVAPLVDLLEKETDEGVRSFISVSLHAITGKKLGKDSEAWRSLVEEEKARQGLPGGASAEAITDQGPGGGPPQDG